MRYVRRLATGEASIEFGFNGLLANRHTRLKHLYANSTAVHRHSAFVSDLEVDLVHEFNTLIESPHFALANSQVVHGVLRSELGESFAKRCECFTPFVVGCFTLELRQGFFEPAQIGSFGFVESFDQRSTSLFALDLLAQSVDLSGDFLSESAFHADGRCSLQFLERFVQVSRRAGGLAGLNVAANLLERTKSELHSPSVVLMNQDELLGRRPEGDRDSGPFSIEFYCLDRNLGFRLFGTDMPLRVLLNCHGCLIGCTDEEIGAKWGGVSVVGIDEIERDSLNLFLRAQTS